MWVQKVGKPEASSSPQTMLLTGTTPPPKLSRLSSSFRELLGQTHLTSELSVITEGMAMTSRMPGRAGQRDSTNDLSVSCGTPKMTESP